MRLKSWDHYELSYLRMFLAAAGVGGLAGGCAYMVSAVVLGSISALVAAVIAGGFAYMVLSTPNRRIRYSAIAQARESPLLASSAIIHLQTTGSKSRTLMALRTRDTELRAWLREVRRMTLTGLDPAYAVRSSRPGPASESVRRIFIAVSDFTSKISSDSAELEGLRSAAELGEETRVPVFITVTFFAPIILILFAALSRNTDFISLFCVILVQVLLLDTTYTLSSSERKVLSG